MSLGEVTESVRATARQVDTTSGSGGSVGKAINDQQLSRIAMNRRE